MDSLKLKPYEIRVISKVAKGKSKDAILAVKESKCNPNHLIQDQQWILNLMLPT